MSNLSFYAAKFKLCKVCGLSNDIPVGWIDPATGQRCDDPTMCHCPDNLMENINMEKKKKDFKSHEAKPQKRRTKYEDIMRPLTKTDWPGVVKECVLDLCEGLEKAAIALGDRQKQGLAYAGETIATSVQLAIAAMRQAQRDDMDALVNRIKLTGEKVES